MKGKKYILLLALGLIALSANARQFEQGEKLYVNADQTFHSGDGGFNWANDNAKISLYVWKEGVAASEKWVTLSVYTGALFRGDMPAGDFDRCIIVRGSQAATFDKDKKWNQTDNLVIPDATDRNYISLFKVNDSYADWLTYSPAVDNIAALASEVQEEHVKICPNALGCLYSLHPKLKSDKSDYDYDNVTCHSWYVSTDSLTWSSVDGFVGLHDGEQNKDTFYILPNSSSLPSNKIYFYLYSAKKAGRRLIKLTPDASGCELDCTITSFQVACSEVNANDTTYTLDGMVAFGEPSGDLVIECDGKQTSISGAKSPQIFSIAGLPAAITDGNTTIARVYFTGGSCRDSAKVKIPNATQGIIRTHIDVLIGDSAYLKPQGANPNTYEHKWYIDGVENPEWQGEPQTSIPFNEQNTTIYTYREFNAAGTMEDLMSNGGYEDDFNYGNVGGVSTISDYNYWDKHPNASSQEDYYATHSGANNGFAVVQNANNFAPSYAKVKAREGQYFALFDAATDGIAGKKAWYANTKNNPNLKLQKGTTYLFSFWAANINNYGEMDNAAELQFQIKYNGQTKKLGSILDLGSGEFRNNRWHQCSATFYADADATDVTISVVNLNTDTLHIGNDFALDDIQFRAVSSATRSVKIQQVFEVQTHEPQLPKLAVASKSRGCDSTAYDAKLTVTYANPKGNLLIEDLTTGITVLDQTLPAIGNDWDKQKTHSLTIRIPELSSHNYKAYFADWTKAEATTSSTAPEFEQCCLDGLMYRKWNNVIFVNNSRGTYKDNAYQWFRDNMEIPGATGQFYYSGVDSLTADKASYHCRMTRADNGTFEQTCPMVFNDIPRSADVAAVDDILLDDVAVYPTYVPAGGTITITQAASVPLTAELLTPAGQSLRTCDLRGEQAHLQMPHAAGLYLLVLQHNETQSIIKINVY